MTTLAALKAAIARVEEYRALPLMDQLKRNAGFSAAERDAWKTAFEWRDKFEMVTKLQTPNMAEYAEGMRLIAEKLR